ncbi:hypothetical protein TWF694_001316 [Orbilia ellipsospora]|uniref:Uncharacterized protein n=1 Tax=Orbilia ellipsospora TaxID=2528407 RepID=A0AAV9XUJ8_9PEZI
MRLSLDGGDRWQLLQLARYLFCAPLQCYNIPRTLDKASFEETRLRNHIDFFRVDLKMLLLNIQQDLDLSADDFGKCCAAVDCLLEAFENLLDGTFLGFGGVDGTSLVDMV